jgi:hypothetical protein
MAGADQGNETNKKKKSGLLLNHHKQTSLIGFSASGKKRYQGLT